MHNIISFENLVALLKCVPLQPNQFWYIYAFRTVRFQSYSQLPSKEVFRTPCGQVQRQDKELDSFSLEPASRPYVRTAYGLQRAERTHRHNNCSC